MDMDPEMHSSVLTAGACGLLGHTLKGGAANAVYPARNSFLGWQPPHSGAVLTSKMEMPSLECVTHKHGAERLMFWVAARHVCNCTAAHICAVCLCLHYLHTAVH